MSAIGFPNDLDKTIAAGHGPANDTAAKMTDFLLHEGPMGYSLFKVVHQPETVGNRLAEVQNGVQDLSKFGKMVSLQSFLPFEYETSH